MPELNYSQRIVVIGVGGAGGNAVNNMIASDIKGVEFVAANTDYQALQAANAPVKIQLGTSLTGGRGAGMNPEIGQRAAEESAAEIEALVKGADMVFVAAGMGGGTGTGAAPIVARIARASGALTVAVVTKPFGFEGSRRAAYAEQGVEDIRGHVDALIVIPNQNLLRLASAQLTVAKAFQLADNVLQQGVRGITDLVTLPGLINLDFADVRTVMTDMGHALMGTGEAEGDNRAVEAARLAIANPLLDDLALEGARGLLINISGGEDLSLMEVDQAANFIRDLVKTESTIIFGAALSPELTGRVRVSVVAAGLRQQALPVPAAETVSVPVAAREIIEPAEAPAARRPLIVTHPVEEPEAFEDEPEEGDYGADETLPPVAPTLSAMFGAAGTLMGGNRLGVSSFAADSAPAEGDNSASTAEEKPANPAPERADASDELEIPAFLRRTFKH